MKKYMPSVEQNNNLKDEFIASLKANIYILEKGKIDNGLDTNVVFDVINQLKEALNSLENAICSGEENVYLIYEEAKKELENLKKQEHQSMPHRLKNASDELAYTIILWKDVIDGVIELDTSDKIEKAKVSRKRRKLDNKLIELETIKNSFIDNDKRLEKELIDLEKDLNSYESEMINEDNERVINDLYRNIKATKSKIDVLNIRHANYSACYNLLDMIYTNAKEILEASNYSQIEIDKAKALLDINKLRNVINDPDKAMGILKRMDEDIKEIVSRTASMDSKVFSLDSGNSKVSNEALAYKEELMQRLKEKEAVSHTVDELEISNKKNVTLEDK